MVFRKIVSFAALAALVATTVGCATMTNGTHEMVRIDSAPTGADVTVDSDQHVTTPAQVNLARGQSHTVLFHKDGYQDVTTTLTSSESGKVFGNILVGGLIGVGIDEANGAAKKLSTDDLEMTLVPVVPATPAQKEASSSTAGSTEHVAAVTPSRATLALPQAQQTPGASSGQPIVSTLKADPVVK